MRSQVFSKTRSLFLFLSAASAMAVLLIFSEAAADGVKNGLLAAAQLLIPSLFPFMVLSSFIIRSGISDKAGVLLSPMTKRLFALPHSCSAAVLLAFTGGFPVGAKCVRLLYDEGKINRNQAEQMMSFCVCSGPAFLITGIGALLLHDTFSGVILYLSQLISGIVIGAAAGRIYPCAEGNTPLHKIAEPQKNKTGIADAFINACSDGAASVIGLTAMVAIFAMVVSVCSSCGLTGALSAVFSLFGAEKSLSDNVFSIVTEVTGACRSLCADGCPLWLLSFAAGFGGLCVHFQIFSILGDIRISKLRFFAFRLMNAFLSSVIVYTVCRFYSPAAEVFAEINGVSFEYYSVSAVGAGALLVMCVFFVLSLRMGGKRI